MMTLSIRRAAIFAACLATCLATCLHGGPALAADSRLPLARGQCPERVQVRFGETAADVARRCGVTPEALDRSNPGLGLRLEAEGRPTMPGIHVTVPRTPLPSPSAGWLRNGFVPVPTPPGALGR